MNRSEAWTQRLWSRVLCWDRALGALAADSEKLLESVINKLALSARADSRVLKVGRTIADLAGSENIDSHPISVKRFRIGVWIGVCDGGQARMNATRRARESVLEFGQVSWLVLEG